MRTFLRYVLTLINNLLVNIGWRLSRYDQRYKNHWPAQVVGALTEYDNDCEFHSLYEVAQIKTQMSSTDNSMRRQRHYHLMKLFEMAPLNKGDVVELGCWRGLSAYQLASQIAGKNMESVVAFRIFDSFQGLSEYSAQDRSAVESREDDAVRKHFAYPVDRVKANLREFPSIFYYEGWIPDRFPEVAGKPVSFVHIDVDLYEPIKQSLQFFFPLLTQHGIIVLDDYGCPSFPGAKQATIEFLAENRNALFVPLACGSAFIVKLAA